MEAATLAMSEGTSLALFIIAPLHAELLEEMRCVPEDSTLIKAIKTAAYNNLNSRLYVALALDPHFKTLPFLHDKALDHTFSQLVTEAAGVEQAEASNQTSAFGGTEEAVPDPIEDVTPPKEPKESSALVSLLGSTYMLKEMFLSTVPTSSYLDDGSDNLADFLDSKRSSCSPPPVVRLEQLDDPASPPDFTKTRSCVLYHLAGGQGEGGFIQISSTISRPL
ncbi:zinc finger BED domain-containing protein 1-like [Xyrichtys novacula]|uniref:Zinc finger BED domain-containing protein 1-like n=1 Tax=Xyrichtys novacula TaxID=13765 RepID=A0AAV1FER1_XYRNO|nr:zinc finger BED domain-containing protein 1-like [Xyrichtys novacula]